MTPEQCKHHLESGNFQAFIEGRLRVKYGVRWEKNNNVEFNSHPENYRQVEVVKRPLTFLECCKLVSQHGFTILMDSHLHSGRATYTIKIIEHDHIFITPDVFNPIHGLTLPYNQLMLYKAYFKDTNVPLWIESEEIK